jgi:hypothetical protein
MSDKNWQYCIVHVTLYRDGNDPTQEPRELLSITKPGAQKTGITNALGLAGLLNELGTEGWELVDVEAGTFYLKRKVKRVKESSGYKVRSAPGV